MIDYVGIVFAILVAGGGIFGYIKAGSVPSLIAGVTFGVLIGVGAYFNSTDNPIPLIQIVVLVLLAALMGFRWIRGGKFMPAGLIAVLSVAVLVWTCVMYRNYLPFGSKQATSTSDAENKAESVTMM